MENGMHLSIPDEATKVAATFKSFKIRCYSPTFPKRGLRGTVQFCRISLLVPREIVELTNKKV
jgi:hypothetical protein